MLIGWGEESLVPSKKVRLAGQFYERISQYVESEITATAMAVEADGEQMEPACADPPTNPSPCVRLCEPLPSPHSMVWVSVFVCVSSGVCLT